MSYATIEWWGRRVWFEVFLAMCVHIYIYSGGLSMSSFLLGVEWQGCLALLGLDDDGMIGCQPDSHGCWAKLAKTVYLAREKMARSSIYFGSLNMRRNENLEAMQEGMRICDWSQL
ncbi:hypothetical protein AAHA92_15373 [Salvia divinorum]|uniref:Uncharacterized protein n=1 Tax=Salvia divinorum TaxID=28513 RepID=A0ABD1HEI4_SALDI